ncbi:MAG: DUF6809 family protein [Clostridia bacterium]
MKEEIILKIYDKLKDEIFIMSDEEKEKVNELDMKVNEFLDNLEDNKKKQLEDINILNSERNDIVNEKIFKYGFKLAFQLAVESLKNDDNKISD